MITFPILRIILPQNAIVKPAKNDIIKESRLFQNFSFGKATLILFEKSGFRPLFRKLLPKLPEFWERLSQFQIEIFEAAPNLNLWK
jgi:hypothetical protein